MFLRLESAIQLVTHFCQNLESAGLHQMILILSLTIGDCLPQGVAAQQLLRWKSGRNKGRLLSSAASRTVLSGEELVFFLGHLLESKEDSKQSVMGPKVSTILILRIFWCQVFPRPIPSIIFFDLKKNETVLGPERHTLVAKNKSAQGLP